MSHRSVPRAPAVPCQDHPHCTQFAKVDGLGSLSLFPDTLPAPHPRGSSGQVVDIECPAYPMSAASVCIAPVGFVCISSPPSRDASGKSRQKLKSRTALCESMQRPRESRMRPADMSQYSERV